MVIEEEINKDLKYYRDKIKYLELEEPNELHMIAKYCHIASLLEKYQKLIKEEIK